MTELLKLAINRLNRLCAPKFPRVQLFQNVQRTVEIPQVRVIDRMVDVPVATPRQVPTNQTSQKTAKVPQTQHLDQVIDADANDPEGAEHCGGASNPIYCQVGQGTAIIQRQVPVPAPVVTHTTESPAIEPSAPAPAVSVVIPTLVIEFVTPVAPAPWSSLRQHRQ